MRLARRGSAGARKCQPRPETVAMPTSEAGPTAVWWVTPPQSRSRTKASTVLASLKLMQRLRESSTQRLAAAPRTLCAAMPLAVRRAPSSCSAACRCCSRLGTGSSSVWRDVSRSRCFTLSLRAAVREGRRRVARPLATGRVRRIEPIARTKRDDRGLIAQSSLAATSDGRQRRAG